MHPLIARFLDTAQALAALEKAGAGGALDEGEAALVEAANANPKARDIALKAKGKKQPPPDAQQAFIALAAEAATAQLASHPTLGPAVARARETLAEAGADADEADTILTTCVLEEAFGWADDPGAFDEALLADALGSLKPLAQLDQDTVDDWLETFAKSGDAGDRALRLAVAEVLLETAWGEGPQNVTAEHLDDALDALSERVAASELPKVAPTTAELLDLLKAKGAIGPVRHERLQALLRASSLTRAEEDEPDEGDE